MSVETVVTPVDACAVLQPNEFESLQSCMVEARRVRKLPGDALLSEFALTVARDRANSVAMLIRLGEIDARQLYLQQACSSMYAYCTQRMRMSENAAFQRIRAARAARRFPEALPMLADGRLHVTAVALLAPHLKRENASGLLAAAAHLGRVPIERMLAARFPKPDVATMERALPAERPASPLAQVVANMSKSPCLGKVAPMYSHESAKSIEPLREAMAQAVLTAARAADSDARTAEPVLEAIATAVTDAVARAVIAPMPDAHRSEPAHGRVTPRAADRYAWQLTADQAMQDMLEEARELMGPAGPRGLQDVLKRALTVLVESLRRSKRAAAECPAPRRASVQGRYVSRADVREVWARDGGQCTFVGPDGQRCCERAGLELDHVVPFTRGGKSEATNLRFLCRAHNQFEAERLLGATYVRQERERAVARAETARRGRAEADRRAKDTLRGGAGLVREDSMRAWP